MTLNEAKSKQKLFHKTATKLLSDKNIPKLLNKYGEMSYVGSYAACLMVKPDIDIEIVNPDISSNKVIELTNAFFTMKDNYSVEIADGTEYIRRPGHPIGYYIGVNMISKKQSGV